MLRDFPAVVALQSIQWSPALQGEKPDDRATLVIRRVGPMSHSSRARISGDGLAPRDITFVRSLARAPGRIRTCDARFRKANRRRKRRSRRVPSRTFSAGQHSRNGRGRKQPDPDSSRVVGTFGRDTLPNVVGTEARARSSLVEGIGPGARTEISLGPSRWCELQSINFGSRSEALDHLPEWIAPTAPPTPVPGPLVTWVVPSGLAASAPW